MDDFAAISQENNDTIEKTNESSSSQSKSIKSFIRTITLPSSPNPNSNKRNLKNDRKISSPAGTARKTKNDRKISSPAGTARKTPANVNVKPRSSSNPTSESVITQQIQPVVSTAVSAALPLDFSTSPEVETPTTPTPKTDAFIENCDNETSKSFQPLPAPPFLLLSQEDYHEHPSSITHVRFSPTGSQVASVDVDGVVKVWSSRAATTRATIMSKAVTTCVDWVPTGDRLLLHGNRAAGVKLFDLKDNKSVSEVSLDSAFPRVNCISCDPKATVFLVSSTSRGRVSSSTSAEQTSTTRSGNIQLIDIRTFNKVQDLIVKGGPAHINCLKWDAAGKKCLAGRSDGIISLYDLQKKDCVAQWQAHTGDIHTVEFSKDEQHCFSMGSGGPSCITQWTLNGEKQAELYLHPGAGGPFVLSGFGGLKQVHTPKGGLFSFDSGKNFCLTCKMNGALLYKIETDPCIAKAQMLIGGHKTPVVTIDWSSVGDCSIAATASMDGTIKISTLLSQSS